MSRILSSVAVLAMLVQAPFPSNYPATKTVNATDTHLWGRPTKNVDRWLENLKEKDVEAWFEAQADLTDSILVEDSGA